jgi:hypothetical protein
MRLQFDILTNPHNIKYTIATVVDEKRPDRITKITKEISKFFGSPNSNHLNITSVSWKVKPSDKNTFKDVYKSAKALVK